MRNVHESKVEECTGQKRTRHGSGSVPGIRCKMRWMDRPWQGASAVIYMVDADSDETFWPSLRRR